MEFLLQHETEQAVKDAVLKQACWRGQTPVMQLVLAYGGSAKAVSFQDAVETWDREAVQVFVERGADLVTNAPFARAFKKRIKAALGIFLDCKRARPDLGQELQQQVDMALRQACQDDDLKWVSLLLWLGANPRSKGRTTEDLDSSYSTMRAIAFGGRGHVLATRKYPKSGRNHYLCFGSTPLTISLVDSICTTAPCQYDSRSSRVDRSTQVARRGWCFVAGIPQEKT